MIGSADEAAIHAKARQLQAATDRNRIEFLRTELASSFTLASLAETEHRSGDRESARRSLAHAEQGYSSLLRFMSDPKHARHIGEEDRRELDAGRDRLRQTLDGLTNLIG